MTDWTTCRVVQDRDGDLWGSAIAKGERWWANLGYFVSHTTDELEHHFGPITPVLDADGLPVVTPAGLAAAWDEGFDAMSDTLPGDYYPPAALGISNPYREVLDLGEEVEQPSELLAQVRDTIKRGWAKCPLCQGSIRQTVGLTCELCGRYHGKDGEWQ